MSRGIRRPNRVCQNRTARIFLRMTPRPAGSRSAGSATGEIGTVGDHDWFALTLEAGKTYQFDLKGSPTGDGTLRDPCLFGLYDVQGLLIVGTANDNGGTGQQ